MNNQMRFFSFILLICLMFFGFVKPALATTTPMIQIEKYQSGSLIKGSDSKVYVFDSNNQLHWIPDALTFNVRGYLWSKIEIVDDEILNRYVVGDPIPAISTPAEIELAVKMIFADAPIMISVAKCESGFRQFNNDGTPLVGYGRYTGVFQIDKNIHAEYAKSLGMDIETIDGNLAYARRLYDQKGAQPWPTCAVMALPLKSNLKLGDQSAEVKVLQKILNKIGFEIAKSGVGSLGNETDYFGQLTKLAVQRFQCAQGIVCAGTENTTGYGLVGPKTRLILNSY